MGALLAGIGGAIGPIGSALVQGEINKDLARIQARNAQAIAAQQNARSQRTMEMMLSVALMGGLALLAVKVLD